MNATVIVAALGFGTTLLSAWLTAGLQRRGSRASQLLDARVKAFSDSTEALFSYERATYNRARARLEHRPEEHREGLRQQAYELNAQARSAIARSALLTKGKDLRRLLDSTRASIRELNEANDPQDLRRQHEQFIESMDAIFDEAQRELGL